MDTYTHTLTHTDPLTHSPTHAHPHTHTQVSLKRTNVELVLPGRYS